MLLFTYGTLKLEKVQTEIFGKVLQGKDDIVKGYKLGIFHFVNPEAIAISEKDCHPLATPSENPNDEISGTIYEINEEEIKTKEICITDDCERVQVITDSGTICWMYVIKSKKKLFNYIKNNNDEHIKIG
ncbi:gamma-glutamylcyclotransferase family protein [Wenyingzhuangia marina]|uniref:Gamma-glutamyl cyclotransferase, AIG2-like n=1 Tax=Wenyingzhuangia marina TaxID=1195760 RepID=A0A1M5UN99_9FLAO|nr:gamma-glutamylcyclotransferase family protein [Wenyingzhuangia marina]GGF66716.1 hypothetical protein GCM10011397_07270 [Wenyingzhuangia marina]SHH64464.1 Gamma-glutamyl cyclotransferase, AIG2-like [Wenyingzhuangia marina]